MSQAITITFSECVENSIGMEQIGHKADIGYTLKDLKSIGQWFEDRGGVTEIIKLHKNIEDADKAYLLIIRKGVNIMMDHPYGANLLLAEQEDLDPDKKALIRGRVLSKHARYNLCYTNSSQEPDYENGKGRIIAFDDVPLLKKVRDALTEITGESLYGEGNFYYDISKTGIGFHGDTERRKVFACRLGETIPLHMVWYQQGEPISDPIIISDLKHGDCYVFSDKATGHDWKKKKIKTLRHAAGCEKYTTIKT